MSDAQDARDTGASGADNGRLGSPANGLAGGGGFSATRPRRTDQCELKDGNQ